MNNRTWARRKTSRESWEYRELRVGALIPKIYPHVLGFIMKKKNKHRCRDWLVFVCPDGFNGSYLGLLQDMRRDEAKAAAQLLLGVQE
jgi:hypothetical protein